MAFHINDLQRGFVEALMPVPHEPSAEVWIFEALRFACLRHPGLGPTAEHKVTVLQVLNDGQTGTQTGMRHKREPEDVHGWQ